MTIVKLQKEGETWTATFTGCEPVRGQYGEQVKFTAANGDVLFLPKDSADRQLERIGLSYVTVPGETLTFSRDPNKKPGAQPYWGISVANVREAQPKASPRVASPYVPPRAGPHIPGLDDPGPQDPDEPLYRDMDEAHASLMAGAVGRMPQPAPTPREQREAWSEEDAKVQKRVAFLQFYANTYDAMLRHMVIAHMGQVGKVTPLTAEAVQAATATCIIQMDRKGLLP